MSQNYLAWNGEEYPWPPPEGWYEASDNRWWAPNSGPGPKETPSDATIQSPALTDVRSPTVSPTSPAKPGGEPAKPTGFSAPGAPAANKIGATPNPNLGNAGRSPAAGNQRPQFRTDPAGQTPLAGGPTAPFNPPNQGTPVGRPTGAPGTAPEKKSKLPLIAVGVAGLFVMGAIAAFFLLRGDPEQEVASETSAATTVATQQEATTTTVETTTTEPIDQAAALSDYRTHVEGLKVVGLDDESLEGIGKESCRVAGEAADAEAWEVRLDGIVTNIRAQQAITPPPQGAPLTETAIRDIYSGALPFYCPADAERLGVTV